MKSTTLQNKLAKVTSLVDLNPKVDFDPETTTFYLTPCNCKYVTDFSLDVTEILYGINSYILENNFRKGYEIKFLGNFGSFLIKKLQEVTKDNAKIHVLDNGDIDLHEAGVTIKLDLFQPFKIILQHINETILDVEKNRGVKIGMIRYLNSTSVKMKHYGKRTTKK